MPSVAADQWATVELLAAPARSASSKLGKLISGKENHLSLDNQMLASERKVSNHFQNC